MPSSSLPYIITSMIVVPVCELLLSHAWLILTVDDWLTTIVIGQQFREFLNFSGLIVCLLSVTFESLKNLSLSTVLLI